MMRIQLLLFMVLLSDTPQSFALNWFQNQQQQAEEAFEDQDYEQAAALFADPYQRGVAWYRAQKYAQAAAAFATVDNVKGRYNLGNSYFQLGQYEQAIEAYQQVLAQQPDNQDAQYNLKLAQQQVHAEQPPQSQQQSDAQSEQSSENSAEPQQPEAAAAESQQQAAQQQQASQQQAAESQKPSATPQSEASQQAQQQHIQAADEPTPMPAQPKQQSAEALETQRQLTPSKETPPPEGQVTPTQAEVEIDTMADALLNRIRENPQELLQGQFYIDAYHAQQPKPEKPW